jgi:hypothetical protein
MGTMTSFFVAPTADLPAQDLTEGVPAAFPSVLCNYLDEMKVAGLDTLLTGKDLKEAMKTLANPVYSHAESGITVLRIDDALVKALAGMTPQSSLETAQKWLAAGEWGRFGRRAGDFADLAEMITLISKLATSAQAPGHGLFFWLCP